MRARALGTWLACAGALGACSDGAPLPTGWSDGAAWDVEAVQAEPRAKDPYARALQEGYEEIARTELTDYDWAAGADFLARALAAAEGRPPPPHAAPEVPGMAEDLAELLGYIAAPGARLRAGRQIGEAQISWDCWADEAREYEMQDFAKTSVCRERFETLLELIRQLAQLPADLAVVLPQAGEIGGIRLAQQGKTVTLDRPWAAAATGAELGDVPVADSEIRTAFGAALAARPKAPATYEITFDFGTAAIDDRSFETVLSIADDVRSRQAAEVIVTGHADGPGPGDANRALSRRRAEAVRQAVLYELRREESPVFTVAARGESDPAVDTPAIERRNRRAVVLVR
jgi:outer membrane protein OmpA-like peptidoglycan-associated protein